MSTVDLVTSQKCLPSFLEAFVMILVVPTDAMSFLLRGATNMLLAHDQPVAPRQSTGHVSSQIVLESLISGHRALEPNTPVPSFFSIPSPT